MAEGVGRFRVTFVCCGRDDGHMDYETYAEAEQCRESYTSGVAVHPNGYSAPSHEAGHKRAGIISKVDTREESHSQVTCAHCAELISALEAMCERYPMSRGENDYCDGCLAYLPKQPHSLTCPQEAATKALAQMIIQAAKIQPVCSYEPDEPPPPDMKRLRKARIAAEQAAGKEKA